MNIMPLFNAACELAKLTNIMLKIATQEDKEPVVDGKKWTANETWQEISRIAAEQAAKPEIEGFSEHD